MNRVIKDFVKLTASLRDEVYMGYSEGELERTTFPYKGKIVDGVIYTYDDSVYLIPISTIIADKYGASDELDNDDDSSSVEIEIEEDSEEDSDEE